MQRCKRCGAKIIKYPVWKGQEDDEPFSWDKIIWKNLFAIDLASIAFILLLFFLIWAYKADMQQFDEMFNDPCGFCQGRISNCGYAPTITPEQFNKFNLDLVNISLTDK